MEQESQVRHDMHGTHTHTPLPSRSKPRMGAIVEIYEWIQKEIRSFVHSFSTQHDPAVGEALWVWRMLVSDEFGTFCEGVETF